MKVHLKEINLKMEEEKKNCNPLPSCSSLIKMMIVENKIKYNRSKGERVTAIATTLEKKLTTITTTTFKPY